MGFLPMRDIFEFSVFSSQFSVLPDVAQHFAAHPRACRRPPRHHAARGRENAGAEAAKHVGNFGAAEIHTTPGPADPLEARDDLLAVGAVLQDDADDLPRKPRLLVLLELFVNHLKTLD